MDGRLLPHFHDEEASLAELIQGAAGSALRGMNLEVISPYFDPAGESAPLAQLLERFEPRETRVYLPTNERGVASLTDVSFLAAARHDLSGVQLCPVGTGRQ